MSNPTILVEQFDGDPGAFTITGPERYDNGLWLEEATTNANINGGFETNTTGWSVLRGTIARITSQFFEGAASMEFTVNAATGNTGVVVAAGNRPAVAEGQSWTVSGVLRSASGMTVSPGIDYGTGGAGTTGPAMNLTSAWQPFSLSHIVPAIATDLRPRMYDAAGQLGETYQIDAVQFEQKDHATSFIEGTRAASSASLAMDEPATVACWYREGYSGAKQFAYLPALGQLGDYGSVAYAAGDLTISTSRNLVIGPFAAFDRALTDTEQARLAATQSWSLSTVVAFPYRRIRSQFQLRPY